MPLDSTNGDSATLYQHSAPFALLISYEAGPKSCVEFLNILQTTGDVKAHIKELKLVDLLMAMNFFENLQNWWRMCMRTECA